MPKPEKHLFICSHSRPEGHPLGSCAAKGGDDLIQSFYTEIGSRDLWDRIKVTSTGCMGVCEFGVVVLVYPDAIMYSNVEKKDVNAIIDEHLLGGAPVERLLAPAEAWS